jgi:hypothetical protein
VSRGFEVSLLRTDDSSVLARWVLDSEIDPRATVARERLADSAEAVERRTGVMVSTFSAKWPVFRTWWMSRLLLFYVSQGVEYHEYTACFQLTSSVRQEILLARVVWMAVNRDK